MPHIIPNDRDVPPGNLREFPSTLFRLHHLRMNAGLTAKDLANCRPRRVSVTR